MLSTSIIYCGYILDCLYRISTLCFGSIYSVKQTPCNGISKRQTWTYNKSLKIARKRRLMVAVFILETSSIQREGMHVGLWCPSHRLIRLPNHVKSIHKIFTMVKINSFQQSNFF